MQPQRLHKLMARAGVASRRRSEELILRGQVKVDGHVVREVGVKVDPSVNVVEVMGRALEPRPESAYLVLNKPKGFLTTVSDPFGRPTVMSLLPEAGPALFPVGRLDLSSEGLLILTNDGELAYRLTHPKFKLPKTYVVTIRGCPVNKTVWRLRQGIDLEDGWTHPATVRFVHRGEGKCVMSIIISEGRKRQVRRMFQAVGHQVLSLRRVSLGPVELGDLRPGLTRNLSGQELSDLKRAVGLD